MIKCQPKGLKSQAGFTLVELAIVMIIIGLLIGGVLKGQALIANAQVTSTVAQTKGIEAATTTFKDTYNSLPGDMLTPSTRLPNCTATPCSTAGDGDGNLSNTLTVTPVGAEGNQFFVHLNAANLLSGIAPGAATSTAIGVNYPAAKVSNNVLIAGSSPQGLAANFGGLIGTVNPQGGLYLAILNSVAAPAAGTAGLTPDQALRIDTKLDDGAPDTGNVRAFGGATCGLAGAAGGAAGAYVTSTPTIACGLFDHIQG
jgi:prepilin-type N-terminal cleavage/methylation domain-containing protein